MDTLCRICLNDTTEEMWTITDEILAKVRSCFTFSLTINQVFPNKLCKKCVNKIEEIYKFWSTIQENEQKLIQHFENNTLMDYFKTLNINHIKEENIEPIFLTEHLVRGEASTINRDTLGDQENNIKEINKYELDEPTKDTSNISNELESIKEDEHNPDFHDTITSEEEDNITLSLLKEDNTERNVESNKLKYVQQNFKCVTCNQVFECHNKLRDHYREEHSNTSIETIKTMYTENVINGKVMYKCEKCDKVYSKKYIKTHIIMVHDMNERPYVCKLCGRTYKVVSDIMRHGYTAHSGHKYFCTYKCGYSTAYTYALKVHEDKVHKNKYKYTCEKCNKCFLVKTWYDQHQNIHTGVKPYVCDVCGAAFHMDKYLTSHRSAKHPQSSTKKTLVCVHCDLKCDTVHSLALHLETEHGVKRSNNKKKKKTLCDICGKILNRPEQLALHRRMHLGEKPYHCSICNKAFQSKVSMHVHERRHARPRAHACAHCGKLYSQPSALYRHQRLHHGRPRKDTKEQKSDI